MSRVPKAVPENFRSLLVSRFVYLGITMAQASKVQCRAAIQRKQKPNTTACRHTDWMVVTVLVWISLPPSIYTSLPLTLGRYFIL